MSPLARTAQSGYKRLKLLSRPVIVLPLIVFAVFVIASIASYYAARGSLDTTRDRVIERRAQEDSLRLSNRLSSYTIIAAGAAGYATINEVTEDGWLDFVSAYNLGGNFPTINAVTYAMVMSPEDAQNYVDERNAIIGPGTFALDPNKPAGDPYIMTRYSAPDVPSLKSRLGLDEYNIPSRKEAIDRAVDTYRPALTAQPQTIKSADDPTAPLQRGFIIFAPIYNRDMPLNTAAERKAALIGTANVSFRTDPFFESIYGASERQTRTYMSIYQGEDTSATKVYEGGVMPRSGDAVHYTQQVQYGSQTFTYDYSFSDSDLLTRVELSRPIGLLIAGILLGGLLSILMLFAIRTRLHKITADKEREVQLAKDELLSLASHQLRTPATGVKQYMGMVLQGFAGEITQQQKEFLQKAYDSNDRQLHVINDILHLAKLDAGRIVLSRTKFDMCELVNSVVDEQRDIATEAKVDLETKMPKRMEVYADSHMMRMVVENLVSNAIKYTHPGGKTTVSLKNGKKSYTLSVKDTGVGIADEDLDKLFKQFSRVANERSHLVSGTGVGLYLVKNLVELHGGSITVTSKIAKGTIFSVEFPREN